ncbi:hypothetical protein LPJ74_002315 [Coemansia sp. RSA 1843]|nr:hypothetical protein LPJ74_002315 [Coemansia sp. RSA 1843]
MDKVNEFITGLQTILDSPNLPRDDLVRVIQSTQREFLFSALTISTLSWPTRTHLELVKIVIGMPIPEPSPEAVVVDPTTSHEADPFFAAEYFDKLRTQLMQMPIQQLADSDGSWVRNIGFSIEATIMQACRRADALEKLEELTKSHNGQDYSHVRIYCAHVLGSGTLALRHWEAIARMMFTMFQILPFSTKTLASSSQLDDEHGDSMHPFIPRLVAHYSSWLQIVMQMIENHGQLLCRRMPTVIEDPATRQFRWGIPTLHSVTTVELLRNFLMRRIVLHHRPAPPVLRSSSSSTRGNGGNNNNSDSDSDSSMAWSSSIELISAEERRLEQIEQSMLSNIIARDASAVYGMMSEHHRLLQMFEEYTKNLDPINVVPGTIECLNFSLAHTCYGLAPILGFEEIALTQAMDMRKILECLGDMKATSLRTCYLPLYGCYPQGSGSVPAYAELLLLRMSTTLFNIDEPWGDIPKLLAPIKISGVTQAISVQLTKSLCNLAVYFDTFSLNTTVSSDTNGSLSTGNVLSLGSIGQRLMMCQFIRHPHADDSADILFDDQTSPIIVPDLAEIIDRSVEWICDFVVLACAFIPPRVLYTQLAATLDRMFMFYLSNGKVDSLVDAIKRIMFKQWLRLSSVRFVAPTNGQSEGQPLSLLIMVWSCVRRLLAPGRLSTENASVLDSASWQQTLALCCPESTVLAYIVMVQCIESARKLVNVATDSSGDGASEYTVTLNREGIKLLHSLERTLTVNGIEEWSTKKLLFVPHIYEASGDDSNSIELFAQTMFAGAMQLLSTSTHAEWTERLGLQGASLEFSERDMRIIACLVEHYVESAPSFFKLLPSLLTKASDGPLSPNQNAARTNPFKMPNIMLKPAPIESQYNPNACNIKEAVLQWRRNVTNIPFSESRKHIQELISECYPSNSKHYLEQVIVQFMEDEPIIGVELVIGSIANHMFKNQIVYSRRASPFYAIRNMFMPAGPPEAMSPPPKNAHTDDATHGVAQPKGEPVFNAVVGGKVRQHSHPRHSAILQQIQQHQQVPTTAERVATSDRASQAGKSALSYVADDEDQETVHAPTACHRILLLLTDLCYGNSFKETPIHMWLTDNLDNAPERVLRQYFDRLLNMEAPNFSNDLPLEPDWPKKVSATISLWTSDQRLVVRPFTHAAGLSVMRHVLENNGEHWSERWVKWAPTITKVIGDMFSRPTTSSLQAGIVNSMLLVPLPAVGRDPCFGQLSALQKHPLSILLNILTPESSVDQVAFADKRDWFLVHVQPRIIESLAENTIARDIFGAVLSSPACLYRVVPWFDVATSLVQNVPLSHGCPVTMRPVIAKRNFVSYLSPLARVLFAIALHADGDSIPVEYDGVDGDDDVGSEDQLLSGAAKTESPATLDSPFVGSSHDDNQEEEGAFSWQWMDEWLVLYISSRSSSSSSNNNNNNNNSKGDVNELNDTIDALLDVYTYSSLRGLRRSIENVITANCLHDKDIMQAILCRLFSKRPLDIFTLHSLRPRQMAPTAPSTPHSVTADSDASFRPGAEIYPLARRVLKLALDSTSGSENILGIERTSQLIGQCMWTICEEPDVRRNLIALKPRLIPKEQRPAAKETSMSQDTILQTTSGSLHITAEAVASSAAYALDRCVYLLGMLVAKESSDVQTRKLAVQLSHSRVFMATLMTTIGDSMRQFATLSATRDLLNTLWKASGNGEAVVEGVKISQVWTGVNFYTLAQRLSSQAPEEYTTWEYIQSLPTR